MQPFVRGFFDKATVMHNIVSFYTSLGSWSGGFSVQNPHFTWVYTGAPSPTFNSIVRAEHYTLDELNQFLQQIRATADKNKVPFMWWDDPATYRDLALQQLHSAGFVYADTVPGMVLDLERLRVPSEPARLRIDIVNSEPLLTDWVQTWTKSWGHPESLGTAYFQIMRSIGFAKPALKHFIAYVDDIPVAVATSFSQEPIIGIYQVGTIEAYRKSGIGGYLTAYALSQAAKQHFRAGILYASPHGYHLYQQLGFQEVCTIPRYKLIV